MMELRLVGPLCSLVLRALILLLAARALIGARESSRRLPVALAAPASSQAPQSRAAVGRPLLSAPWARCAALAL